MSRSRIKEAVVMMLIRMEIVVEVLQAWRHVRVCGDLDGEAFSRNPSSSPWMDASSDMELSWYGLKGWLGGYTEYLIRWDVRLLKRIRRTDDIVVLERHVSGG